MHTTINKAPIVGYVRYSQKIIFGDKERDMIEPEYFEYRFNIFKNVTLKSFQQQTNTNFVLLVLHSDSMPSHYKEKFRKLEKENQFLYNIYVKDTYESFDEAILNSVKYISFVNDVAVTFRIDNDDAVQLDFIQKLSFFLKNDFKNNSISMPTNYIVKRITEKFYKIEERYYPANSIGLANVTTSKNFRSIFDYGQHHLVNDNYTMIVMAKNHNGGLMTINGENAINTIDDSRAITLEKEKLNNFLIKRKIENIDLECLNIFNEDDNSSKFSIKKILNLFIPPIIKIITLKVRSLF